MKTTHSGTPKGTGKKRKAVKRVATTPSKAPSLELRDGWIYKTDQLATLLQVTTKTARAIVAAKELPAKKVRGKWRILGADVRAYLRSFRPLLDGDTGLSVEDAEIRRRAMAHTEGATT